MDPLPFRQQHHTHVQALVQDQVNIFQRSVYARAVAIVHQQDVVGELADEAHLLHRQGSAAGGHHVVDTQLLQHHVVYIALNDYALVLPGNLVLGVVDTDEDVALAVYLRVGGINVLGGIVRLESTAAERDGAPAH